MNTPRTRPLKRWSGNKPRPDRARQSVLGILDGDYLKVLGAIAVRWPYLEEAMIHVFARLLDVERFGTPIREVYRSIVNAQIRITVMRTLLEQSPENRTKGHEYDDVIEEFAALNALRNDYLHGIWSTERGGNERVFLASPASARGWFTESRPVKLKELESVLNRMGKLRDQIAAVTGSAAIFPAAKSKPIAFPQPLKQPLLRGDNDS